MGRAKTKLNSMKRVVNSDLDPFAEAIEATADDVDEIYQAVEALERRFEDLLKHLRYDDKKFSIVAGDSSIALERENIIIKSGSASIQLKKDGRIFIKGDDISIVGAGRINVNASGDVSIKGSKLREN